MTARKSLSYLLTCIVIAYSITSCKQERESDNPDETGTIEASDANILLEDLEGNEVDLNKFKGKVVFLNFWATWCKPCIAEMPSIDRLIKEVGDQDYVFLAASDENVEKIQRFATKYPHEFQYVHLKTNVYQLGLSVLPTTYIINKEGEIVEKVVGSKEWDSQDNIQHLREIQNFIQP